MHYENEKKRLISFCGSYCHTCDWFTGRIRSTAHEMLDIFKTYNGFPKLLGEGINPEDIKTALEMIANSGICSGCKQQIPEDPSQDRCAIRQCCSQRGFDTCAECEQFPCDLLESSPGVIKFGCIENLKEIQRNGLEHWIDAQWREII